MSTLSCPLQQAVERDPSAPALVTPARSLTFEELERLVAGTAARLRKRGLHENQRVTLHLPNVEAHVILLLAILRSGSVAAPISTRLPTEQIGERLRHISSTHIISDQSLDAQQARCHRPDELVAQFDEGGTQTESFDEDRPATIVFTSGSTGRPKAAAHSIGNHYFSALGSNENIPLAPGDRWLLSLPLYHVGGLAILFRCLLAGAAVVVPPPGAVLAHTLEHFDITHASMVATQLRRLLTSGRTLPALKALLLGGGPLPPALLKDASSRGWPLHTSYGLTEMSSQVTTTPPRASLDHITNTAGRVLPHRQICTADDNEILVRGRTLFLGYFDGTTIHPAVDEDGWFHTRDIGRFDRDGYLHVTGRKDLLFISGGENIQPEEIEDALTQLEGIVQAVVVPVADEEFGHRPAAFVQAEDTSLDDLANRLDGRLPRFKIPVAFFPWPVDVPSTSIKVDRGRLQERAEALVRSRS